MSEERFWDLTLPEFQALSEVRTQSQKDVLLGFQFLATIISRCHGADVNFMPEGETKVITLDDAEVWFKAMAEAHSKQNGKELGD